MDEAPTIDELVVAGEPAAWSGAGFTVAHDVVAAGSVRIRPAGPSAGRGIVSWSLRGLGRRGAQPGRWPGEHRSSFELDGLPTEVSERPPVAGAPHPNGVVSIDHVVAFSPDLERTLGALEAAGLELRRLREGPTPGGAMRQGFFRLGEVILEVIEAPEGTPMREHPDGPARLWGISFLVEDLDESVARLGELIGTPRDAVQPGRRIATLRREAGLGAAASFITRGPGAA